MVCIRPPNFVISALMNFTSTELHLSVATAWTDIYIHMYTHGMAIACVYEINVQKRVNAQIILWSACSIRSPVVSTIRLASPILFRAIPR